MNKNIKLFIVIILLTVLIGWSIYSLYIIVRDKGKQDIYENVFQGIYNTASNEIVNAIVSQIQSKGEIIINFENSQLILVPKVVPNNLIPQKDEE